jgi:hypothetical protein
VQEALKSVRIPGLFQIRNKGGKLKKRATIDQIELDDDNIRQNKGQAALKKTQRFNCIAALNVNQYA